MNNILFFLCPAVNISALISENKPRKIMSAPNKSGEGGERKKKESILDLSRWVFYLIKEVFKTSNTF